MVLTYTPESIAAIEDINGGKSYSTLLGSNLMKDLALFVQKGMGLADLQAGFTAIKEYFTTENGDIKTLQLAIILSLQKDGFLPREVNVEAELEKANNLAAYVPPQNQDQSL